VGFETWNVRSLYRSGSSKTAGRKLAKFRLELVGVQGWLGKNRELYFSVWNSEGMYHQSGTGVLYTTELSLLKKEFVSTRVCHT